MKKYMIQVLLVAVALTFAATTSFAANASIIGATSIGGSPFKPSTKVTLEVTSNATAYTSTSCHLSGSKEYASIGGNVTGDASTIFSKDIPAQGNNTTCNPTDPGTTAGDMPTGTWN